MLTLHGGRVSQNTHWDDSFTFFHSTEIREIRVGSGSLPAASTSVQGRKQDLGGGGREIPEDPPSELLSFTELPAKLFPREKKSKPERLNAFLHQSEHEANNQTAMTENNSTRRGRSTHPPRRAEEDSRRESVQLSAV